MMMMMVMTAVVLVVVANFTRQVWELNHSGSNSNMSYKNSTEVFCQFIMSGFYLGLLPLVLTLYFGQFDYF